MPFISYEIGVVILIAWLTLTVVLCIGVIARALWVPGDIRRRCCCGACGYAIADTSTGRCPECGAAFAKAGISTPALAVRLRGGLGWALLAWTAIWMLAGGAAWVCFENASLGAMTWAAAPTPGVSQQSAQFTLSPSPFWAPDSTTMDPSLNYRIDVVHEYVVTDAVVKEANASLVLRVNGSASFVTLKLDKEADRFEMTDTAGKPLVSGSLAALSAEVVRRWFDAAGVDTTSKLVDVGMGDALKLMRLMVDDPAGMDAARYYQGGTTAPGTLNQGSVVTSSGGGPIPGVGIGSPGAFWTPMARATFVIIGTLYVVGGFFIVRQNRHLLA